jgi:hypothetical protein
VATFLAGRYVHDLLRQFMRGFALARQWAGIEQEVEQLNKEIAESRFRQPTDEDVRCSHAKYENRDYSSRKLLSAIR